VGGGKNLIANELDSLSPNPSPAERGISASHAPIQLERLEVKNLHFRFTGRNLLLENVSFEVKKGEMLALTGESGSGKSTILQILQRFYEAESGEILVNKGLNWQEIDTQTWRNVVSIVPQEITVFSGTLLENICLDNPQQEAEKVVAFCQNYGFSKYFEAFPQHYFTLVGEEHIHLSGGQKQLLALARALYRQPQLLLLDEATSAMDTQMEQFVLNLLNRLKHNMMILMITHKYQIVNEASSVIAL
jgi:ATP-binding cassette, subfamily C, bacteriocin exporter